MTLSLAGRRRCPGEALAKSAMFMIFTGVMHHFDLLPVPGQQPNLDALPGMIIAPKPYEVLLRPRNTGAAAVIQYRDA